MGSVQAPLCKLCGEKHWLSQGHGVTNAVTNVTHPVTEIGESVTNAVTERAKSVTNAVTNVGSVTHPVTEVTNAVTVQFVSGKHCPTCRCAKVYADHAERQRAYRGRQEIRRA